MQTHTWSLQDAKNKFSAVVDAAQTGETQIVTRRGVPTVAVVSIEGLERLQKGEASIPANIVDHLLSSPRTEQDSELFERADISLRDVDFER